MRCSHDASKRVPCFRVRSIGVEKSKYSSTSQDRPSFKLAVVETRHTDTGQVRVALDPSMTGPIQGITRTDKAAAMCSLAAPKVV